MVNIESQFEHNEYYKLLHVDISSMFSTHFVNNPYWFQVKNLRSQVSRLAIVALGEMFAQLKKSMDAVSISWLQYTLPLSQRILSFLDFQFTCFLLPAGCGNNCQSSVSQKWREQWIYSGRCGESITCHGGIHHPTAEFVGTDCWWCYVSPNKYCGILAKKFEFFYKNFYLLSIQL